MSTLFANNNYSFFALPLGWLVAMAPHAYAITLQNKDPKEKWPNSAPRQHIAKLNRLEKPNATQRAIMRAEAAQQNGHENLGLFAASIVAGNIAKLPSTTLNQLAFGYLATRIVYNIFYVGTEDETVSNARSASYLAGIGCIFTLFIKAGYAMKNAF